MCGYEHLGGGHQEEVCVFLKAAGKEADSDRYEIRDPVPDETGSHATYKTSANQLIPIPKDSSALVPLPPGKHVLARYPDTTAFYRAEVISTNKVGLRKSNRAGR